MNGARDPWIVDRPVLIIDDHELFATMLGFSLREHVLSVHQVTRTHDFSAILAQASAVPAGLVLLGLQLGQDETGRRLDGVELIPGLRALGWEVLVVSDSRDRAADAAAMAAGALCVVTKRDSFTDLLDSVRAAATGHPVMCETPSAGLAGARPGLSGAGTRAVQRD